MIVFLMLATLFLQEIAKLNINFYLDTTAAYPSFFEQSPEIRKQQLDDYRERWPAFHQYAHHPQIGFLHHLSLSELKAAKWVLAGLLVVLHLILNLLFLRMISRKKTARFLIGVTLIALFFSAFFFALDRFVTEGNASYNVARELLGFVQGPLPAVFLAFGSFIHKRFSRTEMR